MTWDELEEIRGMVERLTTVLLSTNRQTFELAQIVGRMNVDPNMAHIATYSTAMAVGLDISRQAGASQSEIARVRVAALAEEPRWDGGLATKLATVRLSLATEARIVAAMTFRSRDDAYGVLARMNSVFSDAALVAADELDADAYAKIISLQSSVVKFLTDQAMLLPQVIDYRHVASTSALAMAQKYYNDGNRAQELIDENKVVHPAFMPLEGRMLAT